MATTASAIGEASASAALDLVFGALADPTRRAILARLAESDASVGELAEPFAMSQPAVSKHLKVLERAGLISRSQVATARYSHLEADRLREANEYVQRYRRFWDEGFDRLDVALAAYLAGPTGAAGTDAARQSDAARPTDSARQEHDDA